MEDSIFGIIEQLTKHDISKAEAVNKLLFLYNVVESKPSIKDALNASVSAIYFADGSDYLSEIQDLKWVLCRNEATKIAQQQVKNTVDLGGVSVSDYFIIEYSDWDETNNSCVVYAKSKDLALADFKKNYGLEVLNIMQAYLR